MKKGILFVFLLVLVLAMLLSGCGANQVQNEQNTVSPTAADYPLVVQDFLGRTVTISKPAQRIVSLAPSTTEILYELGLGEKIVGVTDFDDYPADVKNKPKVGDFAGPNIEAIVAQKPDLIFASSLSGKEQVERMTQMGIPVVMLEARKIGEIYSSIELIGKITGSEEKGQNLAQALQTRLAELSNKVKDLPKVKTYYIVDMENNWTAGQGTFIHELLVLAGAQNVAEEVKGWAEYSLEKIVAKNPEVIITSTHTGKVAELKKMAGFQDIKAVKNGKVYVIEDPNIVSRPSPRIVLALEQFIKFVHPEAMQ